MSHDLAERIISAAAASYGVCRSDVVSGGYQNCAAARNAAIAIMLDVCPRMTYAKVGLMMDGRQPATVRNGAYAHRHRLATGCPVSLAHDLQIRKMIGANPRRQADVLAAMGL